MCNTDGMTIGVGELKSCRKHCPAATLSTNLIRTALKLNLGSCDDQLANNHLSYRSLLFSGNFTNNDSISQGCTNFPKV